MGRCSVFELESVVSLGRPQEAVVFMGARAQRIRSRPRRALHGLAWTVPSQFTNPPVHAGALRGMSVDRVRELARVYGEQRAWGPGAPLFFEALEHGDVAWVTQHLDVVAEPIVRRLGGALVHAPALAHGEQWVTGELVRDRPQLEVALDRFIEDGQFFRECVYGYGRRAWSRSWMQLVGQPCAVVPEGLLERAARRLGWDVIADMRPLLHQPRRVLGA